MDGMSRVVLVVDCRVHGSVSEDDLDLNGFDVIVNELTASGWQDHAVRADATGPPYSFWRTVDGLSIDLSITPSRTASPHARA